MTEVLCLINTRKQPTPEESTTVGRQVGDDYLSQYLVPEDFEYNGYIIKEGQFAPFWRLKSVPDQLESNLWRLSSLGYIGAIYKEGFSL